MANLVGAIADGVVAALEQPETQAAIESMIARGEASLESLLASAIKGMPRPGGLLGAFFPAIESALLAYIPTLLAKYSAAEIVAFLLDEAKAEAKRLGG